MWTAEQKHIGQITAEANLAIINRDPAKYLETFVTVDENWAVYLDSEAKVQSME